MNQPLAALLAALCGIVLSPALRAADQPNILYIVADDLGWKDVGFHGCTELLARELAELGGRDSSVPIAPLAGGEAARLTRAIARVKGNTAERKAKIASLLHNALNRTISRTDDWWDPYVGLRGRYHLNDQFYLTAKGDVGGFSVGADLSWQVEGGVGMMVAKHIFSEVGYRALGVDYDQDGLVVDTITHGLQLTLGINF